ncbi:DUF6455 family protein [Alkalilimnicola sp. S0819]|uniref:DUF6455 family protein n=1 Tax=Alkalilimnicola sp. S0819 TaxID=2613922 RepID=UPI0012620CED|nr:DUF6455 family protein [Alkalilimnicola sp. S0819]KAB7624006.1 hypothetical protein F3N43_08185 [Alkalilimnicola sp. S0819]MPQ16614.1 hypothetical protein [Alkalilimnicola sp. S0819]
MNTQYLRDRTRELFRGMMAAATERRLHLELGDAELGRLYKELGVDRDGFRGLLLSGGEWRERLPRMMRRFGVKPEGIAEGARLEDMQRVCAGCPAQYRCARALARGDNAATCAAFCPNADTFESLQAA